MGGLGLLDGVGYLLQQALQLVDVLVLTARVQDEADALETLNPVFVLVGLAAEVAARQAHLRQIFHKGLVVLLVAEDPVNDLGPVPERVLAANEEVVLVEDAENAGS